MKSRKATIVPDKPINGLYPTLRGRIYREKGLRWGQVDEYFVPDEGQGVSEYDSVIHGFGEVKNG
jgi:hypothetical protein